MSTKTTDKEIEKSLISAILNEPDKILPKIRNSGIDRYSFKDVNYSFIFGFIEPLIKQRKSISYIIVKTIIEHDPDTDNKSKTAFIRALEECYLSNYELSELSLDVIVNKKLKNNLFDLAKTITDGFVENKKPEEIFSFIEAKIKKYNRKAVINEQENRDYFTDWGQRKSERLSGNNTSSKSLKFHGWLEFLNKYFPRGIETQTITTIGGVTGVGKSLLLNNMIYMAIHPHCGLSGIYFIAENKYLQATSRLDAIVTETSYNKLFEQQNEEEASNDEDDLFFDTAQNEGWGTLRCIKMIPQSFSAADIELKIEEFKEIYNKKPDFICIDSPDHMEPLHKTTVRHENKGQVYWDLKSLITEHDVICLTSLPLTRSASKKDIMEAEDAAGSYDISRIADNQIFFLKRKEDFNLGKRGVQMVKLRDAELDSTIFDLKISPCLRLSKFDNYLNSEAKTEDDNQTPKKISSPSILRFLQEDEAETELKKASELFLAGTDQDSNLSETQQATPRPKARRVNLLKRSGDKNE